MPIRPEEKNRYPKDWAEISARIRIRAGNKCEECGVPNYEKGGRAPDGTWHKALPTGAGLRTTWPREGEEGWCEGYHLRRLRIVRIVLTVAHMDHQPENCADENLRAWCQRCHLRYDRKHHQANARKTRERRSGQMTFDV